MSSKKRDIAAASGPIVNANIMGTTRETNRVLTRATINEYSGGIQILDDEIGIILNRDDIFNLFHTFSQTRGLRRSPSISDEEKTFILVLITLELIKICGGNIGYGYAVQSITSIFKPNSVFELALYCMGPESERFANFISNPRALMDRKAYDSASDSDINSDNESDSEDVDISNFLNESQPEDSQASEYYPPLKTQYQHPILQN